VFRRCQYGKTPLALLVFVNLLGKVILKAYLLDELELRLEPINVLLFIDQELFE
jgi:hypothetical protein